MQRRRYLALTGLAASTALAGCGGGGDDASDSSDGVTDDESTDDASSDGNGTADDGTGDGAADDGPSDGTEDDGAAESTLELRNFIVPESANIDEEIVIGGQVANTGDEPQVYTETVYVSITNYGEPDEWRQREIEEPVPPGNVIEWTLEPLQLDRPARLFARLGEDGEANVVEVPPERAPYVSDAAAVSGWEEPGDLEAAAIEQAPAGSVVEFAYQYWFYIEDQRRDSSIQITVFDSESTPVGSFTESTARDVEQNGWQPWESTVPVSTEGADPGEYTIEIVVIDENSGVDSDTVSVSLELVANE